MSALPQDHRSPDRQQRWIELKNVGASTIPAFGVVEVDDASRDDMGRTVLHVKRPTAASLVNVVVNGHQEIPVDGEGRVGTNDFPAYALYTGGTPSPGASYGTAVDSYLLESGATGFIICGDSDGTIVRVMRDGGGGSQWLFGQLAEDMCVGDGSADIDNITDVDTGASIGDLTALNTFALAGLDNDYVLLKYIAAIGDWVIIQVKHHAVAVLVEGSVYIDGLYIKGKVRDIAAMYCADERTVTLLELEECE